MSVLVDSSVWVSFFRGTKGEEFFIGDKSLPVILVDGEQDVLLK